VNFGFAYNQARTTRQSWSSRWPASLARPLCSAWSSSCTRGPWDATSDSGCDGEWSSEPVGREPRQAYSR